MASCSSSFGLPLYGSPPMDGYTAITTAVSSKAGKLYRGCAVPSASMRYIATASTGATPVHMGATTNCKNCGGALNWLKRCCEYCGTFFH